MRSDEIARARWDRFADELSDRHRGWLTTVRARSGKGDQHELWRDAALERVELGEHAIVVARAGGARVTFDLAGPKRVLALSTDDGADLGVRVEATDGSAAEVRFRVSARPENVDDFIG